MLNAKRKTKTISRAIRLGEVCHLTGVSRATVWRWAKTRPDFPQPFKISDTITVWDESEVTSWLRTQRWVDHG